MSATHGGGVETSPKKRNGRPHPALGATNRQEYDDIVDAWDVLDKAQANGQVELVETEHNGRRCLRLRLEERYLPTYLLFPEGDE